MVQVLTQGFLQHSFYRVCVLELGQTLVEFLKRNTVVAVLPSPAEFFYMVCFRTFSTVGMQLNV
jgi:hypothetical protein